MSKRKKTRQSVTLSCEQCSVTGSCNMLAFTDMFGDKRNLVIDAGIFQGKEEDATLNDEFKVIKNFEKIENILITHSHVDHCGRLPLMGKLGFAGKIMASNAASILMKPAIIDTYKIEKLRWQKQGVAQKYNNFDIGRIFSNINGVEYYNPIRIYENAYVTFIPNGHMVGASQILFQLKDDNDYNDVNLLFTGDYNDSNLFMDIPPIPNEILELPISAVITESTYGSSKSEKEEDTTFEDNIVNTLACGGTVLICALSQERTEVVLYKLKQLQQQKRIDANIPIFLDGNLSKTYLHIYTKRELGIKPSMKDFVPVNLEEINNEEHRASVIAKEEPKIIVTSSGMGSNGPAPEYIVKLMHNKRNLIQFTSYLPEGTAGRTLQDAIVNESPVVSIFGRILEAPTCKVGFSTAFSSHGKSDVLLKNIAQFKKVKSILITHGATEKKAALGDYFLKRLNNGPEGKCPPLYDFNSENTIRVYSNGVGKMIYR